MLRVFRQLAEWEFRQNYLSKSDDSASRSLPIL